MSKIQYRSLDLSIFFILSIDINRTKLVWFLVRSKIGGNSLIVQSFFLGIKDIHAFWPLHFRIFLFVWQWRQIFSISWIFKTELIFFIRTGLRNISVNNFEWWHRVLLDTFEGHFWVSWMRLSEKISSQWRLGRWLSARRSLLVIYNRLTNLFELKHTQDL